jgi:hypothetical protein
MKMSPAEMITAGFARALRARAAPPIYALLRAGTSSGSLFADWK